MISEIIRKSNATTIAEHRSRSTRINAPSTRTVNIALLGCGTIGSEIARLLTAQRQEFKQRTGIDVCLKRILVRNQQRDCGIDASLFTSKFEAIRRDDIDIAIEVIGGVEPAFQHVSALLASGVSVITANKSLIAHRGEELRRIAAEHGSHLRYEATVCAAVPVLGAIESLRGDTIHSITGIVNGSCNYILTRMSEASLSLSDAVHEAQERGLLEPDPSADLSGRDSAEKLCILAEVAGFGRISPNQIEVNGIEHISHEDILAAKRCKCVIKFLASVTRRDDMIIASVMPTFVPRSHPLAAVRSENNALLISTSLGGELFLQGKGAGPKPTAAAILCDLVRISGRNPAVRGVRSSDELTPNVIGHAHIQRAFYYARLTPAADRRSPQTILTILNQHGVHTSELDCTREHTVLHANATSRDALLAAIQELQSASALIARTDLLAIDSVNGNFT